MTKEQAIQEIARRLVERYHPERIYLFGSVARADDGPDSDLDFCVVLADVAPEDLFRNGLSYRELDGIGYPADVIPWRQGDFDARGARVVASLPATILREGRLVHDARPVVA
jgi:uncharacterized protein